MWRTIRIAILLVVLAVVAGGAWIDQHRTTSWQHTVWVGAFPVNADDSAAAAAYLATLDDAALQPVADFIAREAQAHGITLDEPVHLRLYPSPPAAPPDLPPHAGPLARMLWSLKLRHYRSQTLDTIDRSPPQITLFLLYHDPERLAVLPHSVGLQRGLMGVVHLFATRSQAQQNAIVVAHELLHTFGATDKYDFASDAPRYPDGYAEPQREPRWPQRYAEIMAGRVPLSADRQQMPDDLQQVRVGAETAREIGWSRQ